MSAHWTVGAQGCTTSAKAAAQLPSVRSSGGGLLRDCGHGTGNAEKKKKKKKKKVEGEDDEDNTPFCNAEKDEMFHDADEIKTVGNEAPIPTGGLRDLLNHLNITTHLEFRIKMMKTTLPLATPRRMRCSTTPMRSRPPEMKPRSPPAG
jgi:hypothetical protein